MERIGGRTLARETLFLLKDRGGKLGILVALIQGQALRIKYLPTSKTRQQ